MKYNSVLLICAIFILSCNNSKSDTTESLTDSTVNTTTDTSVSVIHSTRGMAEVMNKMMQDMKTMQMTGDPDNDFAMMMKSHHMGAIEMANIEISNGKDPDLKAMAQKMINDQQKEINEFNSFLSTHNPHSKTDFSDNAKKMMEKSSSMSLNMHGADIDMDFATMMVQHHQDAIDMAKEYLKTAHEPTIKTIAQNIISTHQTEIKQLNDWKSKHNPGAH
jgi:uncharacterized protein (DUF305 family)